MTASNENILLGGSSEENLLNKEGPNAADELDGVKIPVINSFFPFTSNVSNTEELLDILVTNGEFLPDGSILDSASLNY